MNNPRIKIIENHTEADINLKEVGIKKIGRKVLLPKTLYLTLKLDDLNIKKAIILKQTMLAVGGDVAMSHESIMCASNATDVILMGTLKQYNRLIISLKKQPFGLSKIGEGIPKAISNFYNNDKKMKIGGRIFKFGKKTFIMGILNVTPDSC